MGACCFEVDSKRNTDHMSKSTAMGLGWKEEKWAEGRQEGNRNQRNFQMMPPNKTSKQ